jgi:3-oxoacyl-[acyl-carrier protein] reductase
MSSIGEPPRLALVTGASRGAGRAIALRLAREGMAVAMLARGERELAEAAAEARAAGGRALELVADVADETQVRAAFDRARTELGGLDVVVLNAGVSVNGEVASYSLADWRTVLDTNLTGAFLCARAAIPLLRARGGGNLIAIASGAGKQGYARMAAYSASKFGLIGLMQSLAQELGDEAIKVSTIVPGSILTEFGGKPAARQPGRKYLLPDDLAEAVLYLVRQPPQAWTQELNLWPF